jgi:ESCRT-II complex subunit VPS36
MMENTAMTTETSVTTAFTDLTALMAKASDMVALAADLNEKLSASQAAQAASPLGLQSGGAIESEEAAFVRSSLVQLGLQLPGGAVTQDMASDDRKWHAELARELSSLLQGSASSDSRKAAPQGLMSTRPIVPLDEVWGAWNRARGVALLPPATLLAILPLLPAATNPPLGERKLRSGLRVLHTPDFESSAFAVRVAADLTQDEHGGQTTAEIAHAEGIAVALAREMVEEAELGGHLLREDPATRIEGGGGGMGAAQIGWWPNLLKGYEWDGQE